MGYLDEEIVALHSEIVELQRSPFARRQEDVMQQLSVSLCYIYTIIISLKDRFTLLQVCLNSQMPICTLKQCLIAVIIPFVHTGH